jgi:hypothetical protein
VKLRTGQSRDRPVAGQVNDQGDSQSAGDLNEAVLVLTHETQRPLMSALDLNRRPLDPQSGHKRRARFEIESDHLTTSVH